MSVPPAFPDWSAHLDDAIARAVDSGPSALLGFVAANRAAIADALAGKGPDDPDPRPGMGAHVVVNIASAHVPSFCEAHDDRPYKNYYDRRAAAPVVGDRPKARREIIDESLPLPNPGDYRKVYFGAVELNGTGIRFYGDVCLVLADALVDPATVILDRNSYDLEREPFKSEIAVSGDADVARKAAARQRAGSWSEHLAPIAGLKLLDRFATRLRRLTTGEISNAVLVDEDYIEVLWMRRDGGPCVSFAAADLFEARLNPADIALEEHIASRARWGPAPRHEELQWLAQRRDAQDALRAAGVPVRVMTTAGRVKS